MQCYYIKSMLLKCIFMCFYLFIYLFINHRQQVLGNQSVQSLSNSDTLLSACKFHYTYIITIYSTHVLQAWVKFTEVV